MESRNGDWFHYSAYWRTWNRVLLRRGGDYFTQIEIGLTPLGGSDGWSRVKRIIVRQHHTESSYGDIWTHHLPDSIVEEMRKNMSEEQFQTLVHVDLLPMVNLEQAVDVNDRPGLGGLKDYLTLPSNLYQVSHLVPGGGGTQLIPFLEFTGIQPKILEGYTPDLAPLGGVYDNQVEGTLSIWGFYNPTTRYFYSNVRLVGKHPENSLLLVGEFSHTDPWEMAKHLTMKLKEFQANVPWIDKTVLITVSGRIQRMALAGQWEKYVKYTV